MKIKYSRLETELNLTIKWSIPLDDLLYKNYHEDPECISKAMKNIVEKQMKCDPNVKEAIIHSVKSKLV